MEELVDSMWSALMQDPDFRPMIETWDEICTREGADSDASYQRLQEIFNKDFSRLDVALQESLRKWSNSLKVTQDSHYPLVRIDDEGQVLELSDAARKLTLDSAYLTAQISEHLPFTEETIHVWSAPQNHNERKLLALLPLQEHGYPRTLLIQRVDISWRPAYESVLQDLFGLSGTEVKILAALYQGYGSVEIADQRSRSVHTVRTQIRAVMDKVGVSSQRALVRLVSSILRFHRHTPSVNRNDGVERVVFKLADSTVECCMYGPEQGVPVMLISTVISPVPSETVLRLAYEHGFRIVAPFRPGSGQSSPRPFRDGPEVIAQDYAEILAELNIKETLLVGLVSGGLYAVALGGLLGERCLGMVALDTGYPLSKQALFSLPRAARRTFSAARYARRLLYAPHKIVANDFVSSPEGERRTINYLLGDSDHDLRLVTDNQYYYNCARELVAFSFEDIERLVDDVSHWAQDWSSLLNKLPAAVPKYTMLGEFNHNFKADEFLRWAGNEGWRAEVMNNEGQLLYFSQPQCVFNALTEIRETQR